MTGPAQSGPAGGGQPPKRHDNGGECPPVISGSLTLPEGAEASVIEAGYSDCDDGSCPGATAFETTPDGDMQLQFMTAAARLDALRSAAITLVTDDCNQGGSGDCTPQTPAAFMTGPSAGALPLLPAAYHEGEMPAQVLPVVECCLNSYVPATGDKLPSIVEAPYYGDALPPAVILQAQTEIDGCDR